MLQESKTLKKLTKRINRRYLTCCLLITAISVLVLINTSCQNSRGRAARDVFEKYEGQKGIYIFRIPPGLVNLLLSESGEPDLMELFAEMEIIKVIICDKSTGSDKRNEILDDFNQKLSEADFEDLFMVNNADRSVRFKIHKSENETIDEIMMLIKESDSFLGLSLVGNLTYDQISTLASEVKIEDFRNMGK